MLTLPQIYAKTDQLRKINAQYVKLLKIKKGYNSQGKAYIVAWSHSTKTVNKDGFVVQGISSNKYITAITFLDKRLHVLLSCSCPDFLYRQEVALHKKKAAEIEYSNGELPNVTNPLMIPYMCKHCVSVYNKIEHLLP